MRLAAAGFLVEPELRAGGTFQRFGNREVRRYAGEGNSHDQEVAAAGLERTSVARGTLIATAGASRTLRGLGLGIEKNFVGFPFFHDLTVVFNADNDGAATRRDHQLFVVDVGDLTDRGNIRLRANDGFRRIKREGLRVASGECGGAFDVPSLSLTIAAEELESSKRAAPVRIWTLP